MKTTLKHVIKCKCNKCIGLNEQVLVRINKNQHFYLEHVSFLKKTSKAQVLRDIIDEQIKKRMEN